MVSEGYVELKERLSRLDFEDASRLNVLETLFDEIIGLDFGEATIKQRSL